MCGINGIFAYHQEAPCVQREELRATRDHMARRGPDGWGEWFTDDARLAFGHRRLAIQDLSERGAQPMHSADGQLTVTFNGEIYNYPALRQELEAEGVVFRSTSDTEVLLHLYRRDGEQMVERLRGMFAFGIWDAARKSLFLARDPFGIKPLYVADDGKTLRFASQVKALLAGGAIDTEQEDAGLVGFFILGSVPEPYTMYRHVRALPAGSTLTVDSQGRRKSHSYFQVRSLMASTPAVRDRCALTAEAVSQAVRDSVQAHLLADVPVGVFLSAGVDSGVITGIASESSAGQMNAVTLGFDEYRGTAGDEMPLAQQVAQHYGVAHHGEWVCRPDFEALLPDLLEAMDQPSIDGLNTYLVSRSAAQQGLKVALSGVGGDELFAGYPSFRQVPRMVRALRWTRHFKTGGVLTRAALQRVQGVLPSPKLAGLLEYGGTAGGAYLLRRSLFMPWELERLLDPRTVKAGLGQLNLLPALNATAEGLPNGHAQVSALELSWYMRNQLLRDADWAGMAHSLEIRLPLVDSALFTALAPMLAVRMQIRKSDLAVVPRRPLPASVVQRPKTGFTTPVRSWIDSAQGPQARGLRQWAQRLIPPHCKPGFRVLALVTDAYGGHGGIAKFNRDLIQSIASTPVCAEVVCIPRVIPQPMQPLPERVRYLVEAARGRLHFMQACLRALRQGPFDLVVIGHINLSPIGTWLARRLKSKSMLFVHGIDAWQKHRRSSVVKAVGEVDHVVGVSQVTLDRLKAWSGLPASRLSVLPNSVDLERFTPGPKPADLVAALGLEGRTVLMTFGRLASEERYKGFDEIIEQLPVLTHERPDLVYLICGDGPDMPRLKAKCDALGVDKHVRFSGFVPEERKTDYYRLADAYVMPSRGEGFGIVFLEAMACGIPAMGSRLDGGCEALLGGQLGELVDPAIAADVREGVLRTLARSRGRPEGLSTFSIEAFGHRVSQLMQGFLKTGHIGNAASEAGDTRNPL